MNQQSNTKILIWLFINGLKRLLYFPLWWYSKGFLKLLGGAGNWIKDFEQTLGLGIWIKNLFVPMFGQNDIQGRFISFFLRLFQIFSKSIALLLFSIVVLVVILIWLLLPIVMIYQIFSHLI